MKVNIQSIHFIADKKLLAFIEKKLEKLGTYYDGIRSMDVYLKLEKHQEGENKIVEVKVNMNTNPLFAKEQGVSFESATDMVLDKLVAQVKKYKERLHDNKPLAV